MKIIFYASCLFAISAVFLAVNMHIPKNGKALVITGIGFKKQDKLPKVVTDRAAFVMPIFQKVTAMDIGERSSEIFYDEFRLRDGSTVCMYWDITYSPNPELLPIAANYFVCQNIEDVCGVMAGRVRKIIDATFSPLDCGNFTRCYEDAKKSIKDEIDLSSEWIGMKVSLHIHKVRLMRRDG